MLSFGEKLRRLRETAGISQTELGRAIQSTQRKISYLERDTCEPSLDDLRKLCLYFDVSADYFLGLTKVVSSFQIDTGISKKNDGKSNS